MIMRKKRMQQDATIISITMSSIMTTSVSIIMLMQCTLKKHLGPKLKATDFA